MKILGIETSCDETAAAVVENGQKVISNVVSSSVALHKKYGGIVPEVAAREQISSIIPVIIKAIAGNKVDVIAVTYGPGLIGSLLVGIETAKAIAFAWNKPLVPVNHLIGHIYANWISNEKVSKVSKVSNVSKGTKIPSFPLIALIVSGGHTDLVLMTGHRKYQWLGGTLDDAAGEVFDKVARVLELGYPGGPEIERVAGSWSKVVSNQKPVIRYQLPRPMIGSNDFDFSFSGLKTAVVNIVHSSQFTVHSREEMAYEFQRAVVDVLVTKTIKAAQKYKARTILLGGGVAANKLLRSQLTVHCSRSGIPVQFPPIEFCIDNGAMIAAEAYYNFKPKPIEKIQSDPGLYF